MTDHYDVIVIGSGAGGGTLAHALAPTGKRILLLERGDFLPREPQNWDSKSVWVDLRYHNSGNWTDASTGEEFPPKQNYYVGGNTKVYGAILFRFRERDFRQIQHVDGVSPPGRCPTPTSSPGTPAPSTCTTSTASAAPTRASRRRPRPTGTRRSATSRGSPSSRPTSPRRACTRSRCRSG